MATITTQTHEPPTTPLNLRFDVVYAPRTATPPFVGYMVVADGDTDYAILAYETNGDGAVLFRGGLWDTYERLATLLRMTH